jgi:hypothetical protein
MRAWLDIPKNKITRTSNAIKRLNFKRGAASYKLQILKQSKLHKNEKLQTNHTERQREIYFQDIRGQFRNCKTNLDEERRVPGVRNNQNKGG